MFLKCLALFLTKGLHVSSWSFSFRLVFVFEEISKKKKIQENTGAISMIFAQLNGTCTDLNVCILFLNFFFTIDN